MPLPAAIFAFARRCGLLLSTALVIAIAGCAAPSTNDHAGAPAPTDDVVDVPTEAATPASTGAPIQNPPRPPQLPPVKRPTPRPSLGPGLGNTNSGDTVQIDRSCNTDAECTVKDVGNCCGYYPACVNVDSPTDPEAVKANCAKTGMASVCGFPAITGCQCVAGQCQGSSKALLE